jgi:hypothetical protein
MTKLFLWRRSALTGVSDTRHTRVPLSFLLSWYLSLRTRVSDAAMIHSGAKTALSGVSPADYKSHAATKGRGEAICSNGMVL